MGDAVPEKRHRGVESARIDCRRTRHRDLQTHSPIDLPEKGNSASVQNTESVQSGVGVVLTHCTAWRTKIQLVRVVGVAVRGEVLRARGVVGR